MLVCLEFLQPIGMILDFLNDNDNNIDALLITTT